MFCLARRVLLWLIALALPLQGLAMASPSLCGDSHARMMQPLTTSAAHPLGHDAATVDVADTVGGAQHAVAEPVNNAIDDARDADLGVTAGFKCSGCAAHCFGVALCNSLVDGNAATLPSSHPVPMADQPVLRFVAEGLERPPRLIFL